MAQPALLVAQPAIPPVLLGDLALEPLDLASQMARPPLVGSPLVTTSLARGRARLRARLRARARARVRARVRPRVRARVRVWVRSANNDFPTPGQVRVRDRVRDRVSASRR